MTNEARSILAAIALGLWVHPDYYHARSWLLLARWRRRLAPVQIAKPLDRQPNGDIMAMDDLPWLLS